MRDFSEADQKKKNERIHIQENPGNLSKGLLSQLEGTLKAALKDGYLSCPVAWEIAKESDVPKTAIGEIADRLSIRITNCQLGCFKIEKTPYDKSVHKNIDGEVITTLETLKEKDQLTCAKVFELARQFKLKPMVIANEVNAIGLKVRGCQLGCF
ncbi:MAG: hypothetical protein JRF50_17310 [Deltaproteobacteria bacterium]|nr:hypothetical protein [Deltaproteobacteria bacterium]